MSCCGNKVRKVGQIVQGHVAVVLDAFGLPEASCVRWASRQLICLQCSDQTWWTRREYLAWVSSQPAEVLKHLADLTVLPPLEKKAYERGRKLMCRLCKCWIPAKVRVKGEKCPRGKWGDAEQDSTTDI